MDDEINEEIRRIRRQLAAEYDNDLKKILDAAQAREATDGRVYVSFPRRAPKLVPVVTPLPIEITPATSKPAQ